MLGNCQEFMKYGITRRSYTYTQIDSNFKEVVSTLQLRKVNMLHIGSSR